MLLTLPNILTILRILFIPLVIVGLYINTDWSRWVACGFYALAGITDFFDGYLARVTGKITPIGRFLDPVADKLLVATVIIGLLLLGHDAGGLGKWNGLAGLVIVLREITVSGLREYLAEIKITVPVSQLAKWKTALQMVSLGFLIVGDKAAMAVHVPAFTIGMILLWISVIFTIITAYDYMRCGIQHMMSDTGDK